MHLFAIDGLRIVLISGMLVALLRVLQVSRAWCGLVAIPLIWFYTAATGWESSAIRASVMMTVVLGGWALQRPGDTINSLAAAAFIILLWEPRQLFQASFQLSFFVVLVIALMLPPLNRLSERLLTDQPVAAGRIASRLAAGAQLDVAHIVTLRRALASPPGSVPFRCPPRILTCSARFRPGRHRCGAARNPGADGQSRRAGLRRLVSLGEELFNHSAWFFMSAMTAVSEWSTENPRRVLLCGRAIVAGHCHLLRRAHRRPERLAVGARAKSLERVGVGFAVGGGGLALAGDAQ